MSSLPALSSINFSKEINSGSVTLIEAINHESNVQMADVIAKPYRDVQIINKLIR